MGDSKSIRDIISLLESKKLTIQEKADALIAGIDRAIREMQILLGVAAGLFDSNINSNQQTGLEFPNSLESRKGKRQRWYEYDKIIVRVLNSRSNKSATPSEITEIIRKKEGVEKDKIKFLQNKVYRHLKKLTDKDILKFEKEDPENKWSQTSYTLLKAPTELLL